MDGVGVSFQIIFLEDPRDFFGFDILTLKINMSFPIKF